MGYNQEGVEKAVRDLLIAIGEDPDREGLQETPVSYTHLDVYKRQACR